MISPSDIATGNSSAGSSSTSTRYFSYSPYSQSSELIVFSTTIDVYFAMYLFESDPYEQTTSYAISVTASGKELSLSFSALIYFDNF